MRIAIVVEQKIVSVVTGHREKAKFNRGSMDISRSFANDSPYPPLTRFRVSANVHNGSNQSAARIASGVAHALFPRGVWDSGANFCPHPCLSVPISRNTPGQNARYNSLRS